MEGGGIGMRVRAAMGARAGHLWGRVAGCGGGGKKALCGARERQAADAEAGRAKDV